MRLSVILLAAAPAAWLIPNHYFPWLSAWQEGLALALILAAAVCHRGRAALPLGWALVITLVAGSATLQWVFGQLLFGGDLVMVLLYMGALACAVALGTTLPAEPAAGTQPALEALALGILSSAVLSVGIALVQWTSAFSLGIYAAELPPGGRPFGNLAQPNHLCTLVFLGLCSLALLRESSRVGPWGLVVIGAFLMLGMAMSGSRTGWVQVGLALLLVAWLQHRSKACVRVPQVLGAAAFYATLTLLWPWLNDALLLSGGRSITDQLQGGVRGPYWRAMLDAIGREPLWGYGWQQVAMAQQAVALDHPAIRRAFAHSHNIVLDAILWFGIPAGLTLLLLAGTSVLSQLRAICHPVAMWLLIAVAGVIAHAMLEYPHEYAYFLLPVGLALGAAHQLCRTGPTLSLPPWTLRVIGSVFGALFVVVAAEYLTAEQNTTLLRLETARIGTTRVESQAPTLHVLTHLRSLLQASRLETRPGMSPAEVEQMHRVSLRFANPNSLYRYAVAAALNGKPAEAQQALLRLCRIHPARRCERAQSDWNELRIKHPTLAEWIGS